MFAASGGAPTIASVNGPTVLATGAQGLWTIVVNNTNNAYLTTSVSWGDSGVYGNAAPQTTSVQGTNTLTFTHTYAMSGSYTITFTVSNGSQQNISTATVNVSGTNAGSVTLSSLSPTSGYPGAQVVLQGSGFTSDNTVHFGVGGTQHLPSVNGTTIYYTIPSFLSPCDVIVGGTVCAQYIQQVTAGSYPISVSNSNGTTQTLNFQVL